MHSVLNIGRKDGNLEKVFPDRYNKHYHKVKLSACPTSSCRIIRSRALQILQAFEAAFLLDPGNANNHAGRLRPPWPHL